MASEFQSFDEFWPFYVGEHSNPTTRAMHAAGTCTAVALAVTGLVTRKPGLLLGALVAGYGPAWVSHFFVEHNRPATFKHPLWSLLADFKMLGLIVQGKMDAEVARVAAARAAAQTDDASTRVDPHLAN